MRSKVQSPQRHMRIMGIRLTGTGTAALAEGSSMATLVDNGTGDYTLTWREPFARTPVLNALSLTAAVNIKIHAISSTACQIKTFGVDGTTPKDAVLDLLVLGSEVADQI